MWYRFVSGDYTPYKVFGFIGGGLSMFGVMLLSAGLIADIIDKSRQIQEKILYYERAY